MSRPAISLPLSELLGEEAGQVAGEEPQILGLTADSRAVQPGFLFAALPGVKVDGARFAPQAIAAGASAILAAHGADIGSDAPIPVIRDENPRRRLALMAARFYGAQPATVVAVTGTNGKTSVAQFVRQIWEANGRKAAAIGTLGAAADGYARPLAHTTPDPVELQDILAEIKAAGVNRAAIEASSHGLAQHRLDGVRLAAAAFTNITQDHLDYHPTFTDYLQAKLRLFTELLPDGAPAIINCDGAGAEDALAACAERGVRTLQVGAGGRDVRLEEARRHGSGFDLRIEAEGATIEVALPLIGAFQIENALTAATLASAADPELSLRGALSAVSALKGVRGRMEAVGAARGGHIYVDYAHTPDALAVSLKAARPHATGKLMVVFGAGGERDASKRPLMGAAAAAHADVAIVTDDNPRSEEPAAIRSAILSGVGAVKGPCVLREIGDRAEAISHAVSELAPGDILLIAGKGHEATQIVGDTAHAFDDAAVARAAIGEITADGAKGEAHG